jgi:hypothetical protein
VADRGVLVFRWTVGVSALLAEHFPQLSVDTLVSPGTRAVVMPAGSGLPREWVVAPVEPRRCI